MEALNDEQRKAIDGLFVCRSFSEMFSVLNWTYDQYGMGTGMSDEERIAEYQWITKQLRKYVSSKMPSYDAVKSDIDKMIRVTEIYLTEAEEYNASRKGQMYYFVREQWLNEVLTGLKYIKDNGEWLSESAEAEEEWED